MNTLFEKTLEKVLFMTVEHLEKELNECKSQIRELDNHSPIEVDEKGQLPITSWMLFEEMHKLKVLRAFLEDWIKVQQVVSPVKRSIEMISKYKIHERAQ
jgi:hypothetical protein